MFFIFTNNKIFNETVNNIIISDIIFKILMKLFKNFQEVNTMHNMDIIIDIDSNIIINTPITANDIEFKQFLFLLACLSFIIIFIIFHEYLYLYLFYFN